MSGEIIGTLGMDAATLAYLGATDADEVYRVVLSDGTVQEHLIVATGGTFSAEHLPEKLRCWTARNGGGYASGAWTPRTAIIYMTAHLMRHREGSLITGEIAEILAPGERSRTELTAQLTASEARGDAVVVAVRREREALTATVRLANRVVFRGEPYSREAANEADDALANARTALDALLAERP